MILSSRPYGTKTVLGVAEENVRDIFGTRQEESALASNSSEMLSFIYVFSLWGQTSTVINYLEPTNNILVHECSLGKTWGAWGPKPRVLSTFTCPVGYMQPCLQQFCLPGALEIPGILTCAWSRWLTAPARLGLSGPFGAEDRPLS